MSAHALHPSTPISDRVADLISRMTLEEKLAQLVGFWVDQGGDVVAPMQSEMAAGHGGSDELAQITAHGLGHYTRVYGTRPVDAAERAAWLWAEQQRLRTQTRLGIPALVHEECLTGLAAWGATTFPTPLAWGASFDPELVQRMGAAIGESMHLLGIHQGLAPVLDVVRDPRWGRVDECIGEDPYLVATIGTAYVRGLQSAGVHATLKHFLGYSASQSGRNHAPVHAGPRELADIFLPPFEMAILDGGVRSVMNSYCDIDGVPVAANPELLTELLRDRLGFTGVVVADYFAVGFLQLMHQVAADRGQAAELALRAGIDVELPSGDAYLEPLAERVRSGQTPEALVDRALLRVLAQKEELGLLDGSADPGEPPSVVDLDPPAHRALARELAEESVVLLSNDDVLPLVDGDGSAVRRIALIGPNADRAEALQGCYSFANHVLASHPGLPIGIEIPTLAQALPAAFGAAGTQAPELVVLPGCAVEGDDRSGFAAALRAGSDCDLVVAVVGDQAGLFGRGTVGEGNDAESLALPGVQRELVEQLVATGTPVVLVVISGRPYELAWALDGEGPRPSAVLQSFFPGQGGGTAIARVLTGAVNPSGRLPIQLPRSAGAQPASYLHPVLGGNSDVTSADSTPVRPFGFGLSYTSFERSELEVTDSVDAAGSFTVALSVTNTGDRAGAEVVQLYGRDLVGSVVRPVCQLLAHARVQLDPGQSVRVEFDVPATRFAFTDLRMQKVVEPGEVEVWVASHAGVPAAQSLGDSTGGAITNERTSGPGEFAGDSSARHRLTITGQVHQVTVRDRRMVDVSLADAPHS